MWNTSIQISSQEHFFTIYTHIGIIIFSTSCKLCVQNCFSNIYFHGTISFHGSDDRKLIWLYIYTVLISHSSEKRQSKPHNNTHLFTIKNLQFQEYDINVRWGKKKGHCSSALKPRPWLSKYTEYLTRQWVGF